MNCGACGSNDVQADVCVRCGAQVEEDGSTSYDGSRDGVDEARDHAAYYDAAEDGYRGSWRDWQAQSEYRRWQNGGSR